MKPNNASGRVGLNFYNFHIWVTCLTKELALEIIIVHTSALTEASKVVSDCK